MTRLLQSVPAASDAAGASQTGTPAVQASAAPLPVVLSPPAPVVVAPPPVPVAPGPAPPAAPAQALPGPTTAPQVFHLLSHAANAVATTVNAATVPPAPPAGISMQGPWVAGNLYGVVPGGPLTPVPDHSEKWYAITKGRFVGVTSSTAIADGAVSCVSHALRTGYSSQAAALAAFNSALALNLGLVEVIGCRQKKRGYVVFYGRIPGVYAHWNGPHGAEAQVKGIKGSLYQGYTLLDNATEAFNYARARGWTAPRTSRPPSPSSTSAIVTLPTPSASPPASGELTHAALYEPDPAPTASGISYTLG
ncbi:hypothetical protein DFH09DRAFT_1351268 [Mycena vulgaris]|nr:hypothetical protein DFH09DRAFT_1351268 [Mycena vulgaris]